MTIFYFGYGSLVNADTVPQATRFTPGTLEGWVREWRVCGVPGEGQGQARCALTVRQEPGTRILGVIAQEPRSRLAELEKREWRYEKVTSIGGAFRCDAEQQTGPEDLFLFKAAPEHYRWGSASHPILQSYLDCVLAGFFRIWGEAGVDHFLRTTKGWHVPILADRAGGLYPRKIALTKELARLFDTKLEAMGCTYLVHDPAR